MVFDASFWLAISIVIFICLVFKYVKSFILTALLNRIQSIENKFKDIFSISEEAENLLKEYRVLHHSSKEKVKDIIASAELEIKQLKEEAEHEMLMKLSSRTEAILSKIHNNEVKLLSELRLEAVNLAVLIAVEALTSDEGSQQKNQYVKNSIDAISSQIKGNTQYLM